METRSQNNIHMMNRGGPVMTSPSKGPLIAGWSVATAALVGAALVGWEYSKLRSEHAALVQDRDRMSGELRKQGAEMDKLIAQLKQKQTIDALTPKVAGFYLVDGLNLRSLQPLVHSKKLGADLEVYLDEPTLVWIAGVPMRLVVFDRQMAAVGQPITVNILAKVKDGEGWVVTNRGWNYTPTPRADNRDIMEAYIRLKPGRYVVRGSAGLFTFQVEGAADANDLDHCVVSKRMAGGFFYWERCQ